MFLRKCTTVRLLSCLGQELAHGYRLKGWPSGNSWPWWLATDSIDQRGWRTSEPAPLEGKTRFFSGHLPCTDTRTLASRTELGLICRRRQVCNLALTRQAEFGRAPPEIWELRPVAVRSRWSPWPAGSGGHAVVPAVTPDHRRPLSPLARGYRRAAGSWRLQPTGRASSLRLPLPDRPPRLACCRRRAAGPQEDVGGEDISH